MTPSLSTPLAAYFAATNLHDVDAMIAPFSAHATVRDEGRDHEGIEAIRAWMRETIRRYNVSVEVLKVEETAGKTIVTGMVTGDFETSPAQLQYVFEIRDGSIRHLEIHG